MKNLRIAGRIIVSGTLLGLCLLILINPEKNAISFVLLVYFGITLFLIASKKKWGFASGEFLFGALIVGLPILLFNPFFKSDLYFSKQSYVLAALCISLAEVICLICFFALRAEKRDLERKS
jgi:hypothetical protein